MSRREAVRRTREILQVRALQRSSAEQQVQREAVRCRSLDQARDESLARLVALHDNWSASLEGPSFNLAMAGAWSTALAREADSLTSLDLDIRKAHEDRRGAAEAWRGAMALEEAAEALTHSTARRAQKYKDEAALNEIADRTAQVRLVR